MLTAASSTVDASGGAGAGFGNNGGGGRFLLGSNAGTGTTGVNLTGASTTTFCGPTTGNPFVKGTPQTPYIPNLVGGAEGFGLLGGVDATSAQFAGVRAGAPDHAVGAIIREHLGPSAGYDIDFAGYDALLFVNLTAGGLADPMLGDDPAGTDTAFMSALLTGGTEAQWFGSGATTLGLLDGEAIWETLIPTDGDFINAWRTARSLSSVTRWQMAAWPIWLPCRNRRRWRCSASASWDWCWLAGGRAGRSCNGAREPGTGRIPVLERFGHGRRRQDPPVPLRGWRAR